MTTRADLSEVLTLDPSAPTKTFVVEAHPEGSPEGLLSEIAGSGNLRPTDDAYLYRLEVPDASDCFWVDQLDERFWNFHTTMSTAMASRYLKLHVASRHDLDWVWLPSDHLRTVWPDTHVRGVRAKFEGTQLLGGVAPVDDVRLKLSGRSADFFLEYLYRNPEIRSAVPFDGVQVDLDDPDFGSVHEAVDRMGRFAVSGDSLEFHLQFVQTVIERYRQLVVACEQKAIEWAAFDRADGNAGGRYSGAPIVVRFSHPIPDLEQFTDALFSSREPFRLWGMPRIEYGVAEIEAVDLHVGQPVSMDIGDQWMRVYLRKGCCGNSVARLASNLQHRFDSALTFADPTLQAALMGIAPAIDGQRPAALPSAASHALLAGLLLQAGPERPPGGRREDQRRGLWVLAVRHGDGVGEVARDLYRTERAHRIADSVHVRVRRGFLVTDGPGRPLSYGVHPSGRHRHRR